jgi:O-antigen ligase
MPFKAAVLRTGGLALLAIALVERLSSPRTRGSDSLPARLASIAVTAWVAAAALSWILNGSLGLGLFGEIEQREGVLTLVGLAGLFVGARRAHREPRDIRGTINVLIASASLATAYALIQFAGRDPFRWANPYLYSTGGVTVSRPSGTLGNPILLGAVLAPAFALALARLAGGKDDPWRLAPIIALLSAALAATLSRGAWLAGAVGGAAALAGIAILDGRRRWIAGAALAAIIPVGLFVILPLRMAVLARLDEQALNAVTSLDVRAEIARGALSLWRAHPWLGVGPDAFGLWFPSVQTPALWRSEWHGLPVHAHSVAFQTLATLGTVGALAGLAWVVATLFAAVEAWHTVPEQRAPVAGILAGLAALMVAGIVNVVGLAGAACFAVLSALLVATAAPPAPIALTPRRSWVIGMVAGATALVLGVMSAREMIVLAIAGDARAAFLQATTATGQARDALIPRARQMAALAAVLAPGEDQLWRIACDASLAEDEAGFQRRDGAAQVVARSAGQSAEDAARHAVALVPHRASNLERLGNALAMRARVAYAIGDPAQGAGLADLADSVFTAARSLAPADGRLLVSHARAALALGQPERALEVARRISALYPDAAVGYALQGAALVSLRRPAEARVELRRAVMSRWEPGLDSQRPAVVATLAALDRVDSLRTWQEADSISRALPPASR